MTLLNPNNWQSAQLQEFRPKPMTEDEISTKKLFDRLVEITKGKAKGNHLELTTWPLPNMKQVTEGTFWTWKSHFSTWIKAEAWLGFQLVAGGHVHVFLVDESEHHGGGFCVVVGMNKVTTYYSFRLCAHEFKGTNLGRCYNRYTCIHCNYSYEVDSSD